MVIVAELLAFLFFLYKSRNDLKQVFAINANSVLLAVLVGAVFSLAIYLVKQTDIGLRTISQFTDGINGSFLVLYAIYPIVIALSEEFVFRYVIAKAIGQFPSAIVFTILHWRKDFPWLLFFPVFVLALCQSLLFEKTKTLVPLIIVHLMVTYSLLLL